MITSDQLQALNDEDLLSLVTAVNGEYNGRKRIRNAQKLAELTIGSRVSFLNRQQQRVYGKVKRILVKNVEVIADDEKKWRVHQAFSLKSRKQQSTEPPPRRQRSAPVKILHLQTLLPSLYKFLHE
jgi:hypothetical protein